MSTTVINILKDEHNDDDPNFVYIGRKNPRLGQSASKWANPFVENTDGTRDEVIEKYRAWIVQQPELMAALPELKGKVLGCYCKPKACHGDVLVELLEGNNELKIHPAAELFPPMTEAEFLGLKQDIREHGQREDIVVWQGQLIDGRHRLRACRELGIEPQVAELMDETDPWQYVVSHNLHRRHLTTAQRAMVADKLASRKQGEKKPDSGIPLSQPTQAEAATMLNVSLDSVKQARKIRKTATPETVAAVERGEITLNAAVATVKPVAAKPATAKAEAEASKASHDLEGRVYSVMLKLMPHLQQMNIGPDAQPKISKALKSLDEPGRDIVLAVLMHLESVVGIADQLSEILKPKRKKPTTSGNQ
jgi:hypothetical protein